MRCLIRADGCQWHQVVLCDHGDPDKRIITFSMICGECPWRLYQQASLRCRIWYTMIRSPATSRSARQSQARCLSRLTRCQDASLVRAMKTRGPPPPLYPDFRSSLSWPSSIRLLAPQHINCLYSPSVSFRDSVGTTNCARGSCSNTLALRICRFCACGACGVTSDHSDVDPDLRICDPGCYRSPLSRSARSGTGRKV